MSTPDNIEMLEEKVPLLADKDASGLDWSQGNPGDYVNKSPFGLIKGPRKAREIRIKWTAENDRKLLLIGLEKEISSKEYAVIAEMFPEKPSAKAIQERLRKLRVEQMAVLRAMNVASPTTEMADFSNAKDGLEETMLASSVARKRKRTGNADLGFLMEAAQQAVDEDEKY